MRKFFGMMGVALSVMAVGCGGSTTDPLETPTAAEQRLTPAPTAGQVTKFITPRFVVEKDSAGGKILFPVKNQEIDRKSPIATSPSGWETGNSPAASVTCNSFSVTQVSTGARICGMKCTDNTYYRMDCKADIFANGFDIVATE
ncbi:hypothetical protein POL68_25040 [Stigmatella sp. ncwal1]|uniref:Uncharacterized protein n=1 Tax=Stigmatella ashevillensis TaxID=2995309 RepID=A0ABT5DFA6_9BACT|nr:hypothetical protein [Stigmatella ashevillena]MDC0711759.1 hypothetical protein [Stigmatella ashevillena]